MVKVIIKGMASRLSEPLSFQIAEIQAGVVLRTEGGIILTISDRKLARDLQKFFKHRSGEDEED